MTPTAQHHGEELAHRGQELYDQHIRAQVEDAHRGEFLVLHVETGDYEIDASELTALQRAKAKHPDAHFYLLRIGHPAAYRLGGLRRVNRQ